MTVKNYSQSGEDKRHHHCHRCRGQLLARPEDDPKGKHLWECVFCETVYETRKGKKGITLHETLPDVVDYITGTDLGDED